MYHRLNQSSNAQSTSHSSPGCRSRPTSSAFALPFPRPLAFLRAATAASPGWSRKNLSFRLGRPPSLADSPPRSQSMTPRTARPASSRLLFRHMPINVVRNDRAWSGAEDTRSKSAESLSDEVPEVRIFVTNALSDEERMESVALEEVECSESAN